MEWMSKTHFYKTKDGMQIRMPTLSLLMMMEHPITLVYSPDVHGFEKIIQSTMIGEKKAIQ
jgi:hypothetical protein